MSPWLRLPNAMFGFILAWLQKTPMAGAYTIVHCATNNSDDDNDGDVMMTSTKSKGEAEYRDGYNGAKYYVNSRPTPLHPCAMDDEVRRVKYERRYFVSLLLTSSLSCYI